MKISLIGSGRVGSTLAYTLMLRGLGTEIVLMDHNAQVAKGEELDLRHAKSFTGHSMAFASGGVDATANSDVLVLSCSMPWKQEYTSRHDIGRDNFLLFEKLVPPLAEASPEAKILVITNPVDVMTYHVIRLTGFGPERVFGTGTLIDSARFRTRLSTRMGIHPDDLRAYILGEHGDTQFPLFTGAMAGGKRILEDEDTLEIFRGASQAGHEVMRQKGHTNFAISMAAALILEAMVWDTRRTIPVSVLVDGFLGVRDVCLSLPVVLGRQGIERVLEPELGETEAAAFRHCAAVVRAGIEWSLGRGPAPNDQPAAAEG